MNNCTTTEPFEVQTAIQACTVRKARAADMPAVKQLIDAEVRGGAVLPRTLAELYENVRDFHVIVEDGQLLGCCALHVDLEDLAELRSLVVRAGWRERGYGASLVRSCLLEARELGIPRVYALTRSVRFFERLGFHVVEKETLPHKVFRDCVRCPSFPECDETALLIDQRCVAPGAGTR